MTVRIATTLALLAALAAPAVAVEGAEDVEAKPSARAAEAAPKPAPLAPEVEALVDKMDAAGKSFTALTARFDYELNQTLFEDKTTREGRLAFEKPNRLRFEFTSRPEEAFLFDGRTLYHRQNATKQLHVWRVRGPDQPPIDSFELGRTPFPMPFGQKKANVVKYFRVSRDAAAEKADKAKRPVLRLVPKPGTALADDYTAIALWVDPKTYLPTRARLWDTSENITTIDFHHIKTDAGVDKEAFARPDVPDDWETIEHQPQEAQAAEPKTRG